MKVIFTKSFAKDLRKQKKNPRLLEQVKDVIENAEQAKALSDIPNLKQLKANGQYYRIRSGDYRIGLTIDENNEITFVRVLHRREVYRFFP